MEYYHADALGSVLRLTDSAGVLTTTYTYEAFGKTTSTGGSENLFQYTGRENDGAGLYYYRARYYLPTIQRFIAEDPIGFAGGDVNLYTYVWNDPINFIDPTGEISWREAGRILILLGRLAWGGSGHDPKIPDKKDAQKIERLIDKVKNEKGFVDPELLLLLLPLPPILDEFIHPDELDADPCEMPGGPPCQPKDLPPCKTIGGRKDNC